MLQQKAPRFVPQVEGISDRSVHPDDEQQRGSDACSLQKFDCLLACLSVKDIARRLRFVCAGWGRPYERPSPSDSRTVVHRSNFLFYKCRRAFRFPSERQDVVVGGWLGPLSVSIPESPGGKNTETYRRTQQLHWRKRPHPARQGWREYVEEPGNPLVNPVVIPSGCGEHANVYAIYAVDSRQASRPSALRANRRGRMDDGGGMFFFCLALALPLTAKT